MMPKANTNVDYSRFIVGIQQPSNDDYNIATSHTVFVFASRVGRGYGPLYCAVKLASLLIYVYM